MKHAEKVLGNSVVAHDDPPKVLKPGKSRSTFPLPSVATQWATVLRRLFPGAPVRGDQLYATACKSASSPSHS